MALFDEHISQAKTNLNFLEAVNQKVGNYHDWQVTICFYTAVHLVNAHLIKTIGHQYRQHKDVNFALNPEVKISVSKLPVPEYEAYIGLQRLSRRSRYLVNEKDGNISQSTGYFTYEKHLARAIRHLDKLMAYFNHAYSLKLSNITFTCAGISSSEFTHVAVK